MLIACVACSGGNDHGLNPGSPTPVTIWHYYNGALGSTFDEMVTDFNNTLGKEKGIVVSAKSKGSIAGVEEAIRASIDGEIGAEALPQIFSVYSDTAYSVKDKIADLSNYLTASQIKEFVPSYRGRRFRKGRGDQNVPHREIDGGFGDQQDRLG